MKKYRIIQKEKYGQFFVEKKCLFGLFWFQYDMLCETEEECIKYTKILEEHKRDYPKIVKEFSL